MEEKPKSIIYKGVKYTLNKGYYKTTYALHRKIWEDTFGEIPLEYHIHHKNGDTTDNRLENLECIHKSKHHSIHFSAIRQVQAMQSLDSRLKRKEWALSENGKKSTSSASKKGWAIRKYIERTCIVCQQLFKTKNYNGTKYCSQACRSRCQILRGSITRNCCICGIKFSPRDGRNVTKTCSQSCKGRLISKVRSKDDIIPPIN